MIRARLALPWLLLAGACGKERPDSGLLPAAGPATSAGLSGAGHTTEAVSAGLSGAGQTAASLPARLPRDDAPFAPALVRLDAAHPPTGQQLTDSESCAGCHADAAAQWRESAHALGSFNNPIYRTAIDRLRRDVGPGPSRFCAGCHDMALLVDGAMDREIQPSDPRAHAAIGCRTCHGITEATLDGNGSYTLTGEPIPPPIEGDAESIKRHVARVALPPLRTPALCASCHRSFLHPGTGNPSHLVGMDEASGWMRSAHAGSRAARIDEPVEQRDCRGCHMPPEPAFLGDKGAKNGIIRSHRFLGGHTYLASLRRDADQLARARRFLEGTVRLDVAAAHLGDGPQQMPADGAFAGPARGPESTGSPPGPFDPPALVAGQPLTVDVVLRNMGVGHRFPGGVLDAQDTWVEVVVRDARGQLIGQSGVDHETKGDEPGVHILKAVQVDEKGQPRDARETHLFRAVVYNHTLPARDATVIQYTVPLPARWEDGALPLRVRVRLRHRSRNLSLQEASCRDARTPRGEAFLAASQRLTGTALFPCAPQPITEIATTEIELGEGALPLAGAAPLWQRLHDHGLGFSHALQERLDEARPGLERAIELAPGPHERAMALGVLAQVAARQGRLDEALSLLDRTSPLVTDEPALARIRGEAFAQVWRWSEAAGPLAEAACGAPLDDTGYVQLSLALGSAGDPSRAFLAARDGLLLQPRDADLLRIQSLSATSLGLLDAGPARESFLAWRVPDDGPRFRAACSRTVPGCALERAPVHTHLLGR